MGLFKQIGILELLVVVAVCGSPLLIIIGATVVGLIIAYRSQAKMMRCPYCAESIQREAKVCRFCGRELATSTG